MAQKSIFQALYHGEVSPWEEPILPLTSAYQKQGKITCGIQEKLIATLNDEGKELFEKFLVENSKLTSSFEETKFKEGFILGARLMIETLTDTRYDDKGA